MSTTETQSRNIPLKLYGVAVSQPTRAVMFLCAIKNIPFEQVKASPMDNPEKRASFKKVNPSGKIPALKDEEYGEFYLYESAAILTYIATKFNLQDLYPSNDLRRRALIDQYLHWHHENTRKVSTGFVAPLLRTDVKPERWNVGALKVERKMANYALNIIEQKWLSSHAYIVDDALSVADILAYEELIQMKRWPLIADAEQRFPNIFKWMSKMETLPKHDQVHRIMAKLDPYVAKRMQKMQPLYAKL
eukprot:CAMPEP_0202686462 /NCGR_PEP_ID=MMETSP1385-20130828/2237_1 /ASSEMBLY_ACC=CAM_ASM_000861 /TAXON_ID=933848 /ORGANISM="Elphidium margaritaceum" /LENGTH=246 /DNA_ID=CAMNT_0049341039 /DNA_START=38 /DNA_END=778 /DNA_ORIENTATION=+